MSQRGHMQHLINAIAKRDDPMFSQAPTILAAQASPTLATILERKFDRAGDVDMAIELVMNSDGVKQTRDLALVQAELAADALTALPDSGARRALAALAHQVATRYQ